MPLSDTLADILFVMLYSYLIQRGFRLEEADLEGYAHNLELKMSDGAELEEHWSGNYYSFECDACYGSMNNSIAYFHCYDEISVDMYNGSMIYFTSDYDDIVDFSGVDGSSDVIYCGGTKK